jgi:hypothetical protein
MSQSATENDRGASTTSSVLPDGNNKQPATPANAGRDAERRVHLFKPGQSGNPAGKRPGTRNRATRALEELLDGEAEALTRKAIAMALAGDLTALRLCLERILPPLKSRPVSFELPAINDAEDARAASAALLSAVAAGSLTPADAAEIGKLIDAYVKAIEVTEVLARLGKLEQRL